MATKNSGDKEMSFFDHLDELRKRLIYVAIVVFAFTVVCFTFVDQLLDLLTRPAAHLDLIYTTPAEALMAQIRLSFLAAIIIALPYILYQLLAFIMPALRETERKVIIALVIAMFILFALGVSFSYFIVFPFALRFFLGFEMEGLTPLFTISAYISFVSSFLLAFGLVFQSPLVFWFLGHMGLVSSDFLKTNRKFAVLIMAVLSAAITPPDFISQILMIGPMLGLYEVGLSLVKFTERKRARLEEVGEV